MSETKKKLSREEVAKLVVDFPKNRKKSPTGTIHDPENLSSYAKNMQKMSKKHFGYDPVYNAERMNKLSMLSWEGDSLCNEALISMQKDGTNPHAIIGIMMEKGIDGLDNPTPEMQKLWDSISEEPEWLDWDRLERGAKIYRHYGTEGFQYQGSISLDGYRVENIYKTLMFTGQYSKDTTFKRFLLTCNFWMEVSEKDGMRKFGEGWKVALQVRLLHTLIRQAVMGSGKFDGEKLGMPINQLGLLGAPLLSAAGMGYFMGLLGYKVTDEEIDDMLHLWRYISYLMGGNDEIYPKTGHEALQGMYDMASVFPITDDEDGLILGKSFFDAFETPAHLKGKEKKEREKEYQMNLAHSYFFVSPETRKFINTPNTFFPMVKYMLTNSFKNKKMSRKRKADPAFADEWDKKISKERRAWVKRNLKEFKLEYRPEPKY